MTDYTQEEIAEAVFLVTGFKPKPTLTLEEFVEFVADKVRIEERYLANQLMGDLGIPANARLAPSGNPIYTDAAKIVMNRLLLKPVDVRKAPGPAPDNSSQ
jgi:hypothetical protein